MATSQIKNAQEIFIGANVAALSTGVVPNDGEIIVLDEQGARVTTASAATTDKFKLVLGRAGQNPLFSDLIEVSSISNVNSAAGAARVNQVTSIGFDGTSGSIDVVANNLYYIRLYVQELLSAESDGQKIKHGVFKSVSSSGQADISLGLTSSLINNFLREAEKFITFKAICSEALAAAFDFDETVSVVKGSTKIQNADATPTYNTGTSPVVGDFVRIGATATGAVSLTSDVYKIVAISGGEITLDRPVQVEGGDRVTGSSYTQVIPAAAGNLADWGVVLTGADLSFGYPDYKYKIARWETQLENFGSTLLGEVAGSPGVGTYESIASLEHFLKGFQGEIYRMGAPNIYQPILVADPAVAGGAYQVITFKHQNSIVTGSFTNEVSPKQVIVAIPETAPAFAVTATPNSLGAVLTVLLGSTITIA
jgi:hypothetical protein